MILKVTIRLNKHGRYYEEMAFYDIIVENRIYWFANNRKAISKFLEMNAYANSSKTSYVFYTYCLEEDFAEAVEKLDNYAKNYNHNFLIEGEILNKHDFFVSKGWK